MSDLISRQVAIDSLNEVDDGASISTAITVIDGLPSAQPEPLTVNFAREMDRETIEKLKEGLKNAPVLIMAVNDSAQQWIPCSERLPEDDIEVFVYLFDRQSPYIAWVCDCRWYTEDFEVEKENYPTAWMPLPECYKGES